MDRIWMGPGECACTVCGLNWARKAPEMMCGECLRKNNKYVPPGIVDEPVNSSEGQLLGDLASEEERLWRSRYHAVLGSERWKTLKAQKVAETGGKCQYRGCERIHSPEEPHHLHHTRRAYEHLGEETLDMLRLLCREHHNFIHRRKF